VQQLIDMLATARVTDFVEDNPLDLEKFGLAKPALEFEVDGGKDNAKHSVAIGFKQPEASSNAVYARPGEGDRPVVTLADYIIKAVDKTFDDLRDKSVLPFDESKVSRITLIGGPVSIVLERAPGEKWNVIAQGRTAPAEQAVATSMLGQLRDLRGDKIVEDPMTDPQPFGMVHPTLTAALYDQSGTEIGSIYLSQIEATQSNPATGKSVSQTLAYATSNKDKAVYEVQPSQVVDLENTANKLRGDTELKAAVPGNPLPAVTPLKPAVPGNPLPAPTY
jgi:hypothetical protein